MSPESVAWMLNQMNPVEAGRLGRRLGSRILSPVLRQIQPQQALATLRRLPTLRLRELREILGESVEDSELPAHSPDTAGSIMVERFPAVGTGERADAARASLRELDEGQGGAQLDSTRASSPASGTSG